MPKSYSRAAILAAVIPLCAMSSVACGETFTLAQALGVAYETNPQLEAQRAAVRAADEEVAKALAGWRPKLNAQASGGYEVGEYHAIPGPAVGTYPRGATVTFSQPLFGGDTIPNIRKARALVAAGREQLLATEESVLLDAATAYMDVLRFQQIVDLEQNAVTDLQRLRDVVQTRVNLGELSRTDLAQTEGRIYSIQDNLTVAQTQLAGARAAFEHAVGRPPESLDPQTPFPVVAENYDTAVNLALQNNPTVLYAREQAIAADYAVSAAIGALYPSLSLEGRYDRSRDLVAAGININAFSITAQLNIPLYQGGAEYAQVRQAKEQRSQAGFTTADAERQVREQLRTADEALRSAQTATRVDQNQVEATQLAFQGVQQETVAGQRTTLDVLIAEQDLVNAEVALVNARRNAYVAAFQILSGTGGLTAKALNLPVKLYDPQLHYDQDSTRWFGLGD